MEEESKQKLKKLTSWDKSDIFWIIFFIALLFMVWSYKRDINLCKAYIENPCEYCNIDRLNTIIKNFDPTPYGRQSNLTNTTNITTGLNEVNPKGNG